MTERWAVMAALALARLAFGYQFQTPASLGPTLLDALGLDYAGLGVLIGSYMLPGVVVALPGGLLGRRYGERLVVGGGIALMALGSLGCAGAGSAGMLAAGRAASGTGAVLLVVMQGPIASARFEGRGFMTAMGVLIGAFPIGVGLAGLLSAPLVQAFGWRSPFLVGAGMAAGSLALFLAACRSGRPSSAGYWRLPSRRECGVVIVAGLTWTAYNGGYYGFLSYLPSLLAARGHAAGLAAGVLAVATWANLPSTMLGGSLAGRIGPSRVFLAGTAGLLAALLGPVFFDVPLLWGVLFGTAGALHAGVIVAVGTLSVRPENRAVGMGLFYTTYYLGGAVFPWLCGGAADRVGDPSGAFLAAAGLAALGLPAWWLHGRLERRAAGPRG